MDDGTFGVEGVRYYQNYRDFRGLAYGEGGWIDLDYTYNITNGLYDTLKNAGFPCSFYYAQDDSWAMDFEPASIGGDSNVTSESVDMFFWAGHSFNDIPNWSEVVFDSSRNWWSSPSTKWQFGSVNLDWLVLYTCDSIKLDSFYAKYNNLFQRLHLMLGAYGEQFFGSSNADVGRNFAENLLDGDTLVDAWFNATGAGNSPAVLSAERADTWNGGNVDWDRSTMANDHYWRRGFVEPDILHSQLAWMGVWWLG